MSENSRGDRTAPGALEIYVVSESADLLLMRRSFSQRPSPGAWTASLHGHRGDHEQPAEAARRLALRALGLGLRDVMVVALGARLHSAGCAGCAQETGTVLLARTSRRVVTPDPTRFDDAVWTGWQQRVALAHGGIGIGDSLAPVHAELLSALEAPRPGPSLRELEASSQSSRVP